MNHATAHHGRPDASQQTGDLRSAEWFDQVHAGAVDQIDHAEGEALALTKDAAYEGGCERRLFRGLKNTSAARCKDGAEFVA